MIIVAYFTFIEHFLLYSWHNLLYLVYCCKILSFHFWIIPHFHIFVQKPYLHGTCIFLFQTVYTFSYFPYVSLFYGLLFLSLNKVSQMLIFIEVVINCFVSKGYRVLCLTLSLSKLVSYLVHSCVFSFALSKWPSL